LFGGAIPHALSTVTKEYLLDITHCCAKLMLDFLASIGKPGKRLCLAVGPSERQTPWACRQLVQKGLQLSGGSLWEQEDTLDKDIP